MGFLYFMAGAVVGALIIAIVTANDRAKDRERAEYAIKMAECYHKENEKLKR